MSRCTNIFNKCRNFTLGKNWRQIWSSIPYRYWLSPPLYQYRESPVFAVAPIIGI